MTTTLADRIFDAENAQAEFEDKLDQAGVEYDRISFDPYDGSVELCDVPADCRLSAAVQKVVYDAGFLKAYVNHVDKWETHYSFDPSKPFVDRAGWRVSYPHKRKEDGGSIWVEKPVLGWPENWTESGYVVVKGAAQ